jgi:cell division protein FtsQ
MARAAIPRLSSPALGVRLPRPSPRSLAAALLVVAVLVPAALWLRSSPIVRVEHVQVTGASGSDAPLVRQAIADAAQGMSTLNVDAGKLAAAVKAYPIVKGIEVHRALPHTLRVIVHEHVPVGALAFGARREAVAADGTVLGNTSPAGLPLVPVKSPPGGTQLAERTPLRLVALLGAAPAALRSHIEGVSLTTHGLTAFLVRGPRLYFGPGTRLAAKWTAAASVLADPTSKGASYIDVRVPERAAAGGLEPANAQPQVQPAP